MSQQDVGKQTVELLKQMSVQLGNIERELRSMKSVLKTGQSASIQETKNLMLKSKLRSQIYELCDGSHTVGQICNALAKTAPLVSRYLKELEDSGLVLSEQRGKERFYYKVL